MEQLWAPWRSVYVAQPLHRGCVFCAARRARADRAAQVLYRGRRVFCLLNRYPYNAGHLMIALNRHAGDLARVTPVEASELMGVAARAVRILTATLRTQGFNLGLNLGRAAGAGIPGHLHMHLVPRWVGDTNFMPVTGGTKVLSTSLEALYDRLKPAFERIR